MRHANHTPYHAKILLMVLLIGSMASLAAQNLTLKAPFRFVGTVTIIDGLARARFEGPMHGPSPNLSLKATAKGFSESIHTAYLFAATTTKEKILIEQLRQTSNQDDASHIIRQLMEIEEAPRPFSFIVLNGKTQDRSISWFLIGPKNSTVKTVQNPIDIAAELDATNREGPNPAHIEAHPEEPTTCSTATSDCLKATASCLKMLEVVVGIAGAFK